ncbi:MAG: hypothetical protein LBG80_01455 [Bacteroidales bacterium]|jgi:hypothetical protein|nr:hypothetical protein [Bacteroidales bacterium]
MQKFHKRFIHDKNIDVRNKLQSYYTHSGHYLPLEEELNTFGVWGILFINNGMGLKVEKVSIV